MKSVLSLVAVFALSLTGCGPANKVKVYPVSGQIIYDGKPASGVQVFLFPTAAPGVPDVPSNPRGLTGLDGRFSIGTFADSDGAADGSYQVVLYWPQESTGDEHKESNQDRLFGWYTVAHSRLTVIVPAGGAELPAFRLPLKKGPPSESGGGIPGRN